MATPIPQIILAIEGRWDFVIETVPEYEKARELRRSGAATTSEPPDDAEVARHLKTMFRSLKRKR